MIAFGEKNLFLFYLLPPLLELRKLKSERFPDAFDALDALDALEALEALELDLETPDCLDYLLSILLWEAFDFALFLLEL